VYVVAPRHPDDRQAQRSTEAQSVVAIWNDEVTHHHIGRPQQCIALAIADECGRLHFPGITRKETAWPRREHERVVDRNPTALIAKIPPFVPGLPPVRVERGNGPWWTPVGELQDVHLDAHVAKPKVPVMDEAAVEWPADAWIRMRDH
jgi:hypothetical protein